MNKFEWKQGDRITCPKCGSENFKEFSKKQEVMMGFGGAVLLLLFSLFIPVIFIPFLIIVVLTAPLVYFFPQAFLGKKVLRKCNRCRKQWRAYPPEQKAEAE